MSSNPAGYANPSLAHLYDLQSRQQNMGDQFAMDNLKQLDQAIAGIQSNPYLSTEEKTGRIRAAQAEKLKWMSPLIGKQRVNQILSANPDLAQFKPQTGTVQSPAMDVSSANLNPSLTQQELAGLPKTENTQEPAEGISIAAPEGQSVQTPSIPLPPRQEHVGLTPPTTADVLASGAPANQFIPVTRPDGTTFMVPAKLALPYLTQDLRNSGAMERTQAGLNSRESEGQANRESREAEGAANRASRETIAGLHQIGSLAGFVKAAAKAAGIDDPRDISPESLLALKHAYATAGVTDHVSYGHYFYKNDKTGEVVDVPITRRTTATPSQMPPQISTISGGPVGQPAAGAAQPPSPAAAPTPRQARQHVAAVAAPQAPVGSSAPTGGGTGRVIGHVASLADKQAITATTKPLQDLQQQAVLDQTMAQYMNAGRQNHGAFTPRQDLELVIAAVRAMNPRAARLPILELQKEISAGSLGDRWRRQYLNATTGLLPDDQREDLYRIVHHETSVNGNILGQQMQAAGAHIPPFVQQYMSEQGGGANPNEIITFTVDGRPFKGTRSQMQAIANDGHNVVREQ